ncbi:MAG TPA: hypothetical protein VIP98_23210 [Microlunatus sp.]
MVADDRSKIRSRPESTAGPTDTESMPHTVAVADADAFAELFRRHCDAVYCGCLDRLGSQAAAVDATRSVFGRFWDRALASPAVALDGDAGHFELLTIADSVCRDLLRRGELRPRPPKQAVSGIRWLPDRERMLQQILYGRPVLPRPRTRMPLLIMAAAIVVALLLAAGVAVWGGTGGRQVQVSAPAAGGGRSSDSGTTGAPGPIDASGHRVAGRLPIGETVRFRDVTVTVLDTRRNPRYYGVRARTCVTGSAGGARGRTRIGTDAWQLRVDGQRVAATPDRGSFDHRYPNDARLGVGQCGRGWIAFRIDRGNRPTAVDYLSHGDLRASWQP